MLDAGEALEPGKGLTGDAYLIFDDALRYVPASDSAERTYIGCLVDRVKRGDLGIYTLSARCRTVGAICYRMLDGDVELVFGHVLAGYDAEGYFLQKVADGLFADGAHTIRSGLTWPCAEGFARAALSMGFKVTERMSMYHDRDGAVRPVISGFHLAEWHDDRVDEVCRIMYEGASPADRPVYPMFARPEGARALLDGVLQNKHGRFLRDYSYLATEGDNVIGFLLSTMIADGSILILNICVADDFRHRGVGGALIDRLIYDSAPYGSQIVLAVTAANRDAIRLYERKGFKVNGHFRQYVLSKISL